MDDGSQELQVHFFSLEFRKMNLLSEHATLRNSAADGILTGLLSGPLIVSAVVYASHHAIAKGTNFFEGWLIEAPKLLHPDSPLTALDVLLLSRRSLINQATLCSTILLIHVCSSWVTEDRHRRKVNVPEGEVNSVPRKEGRRAYLYVLFTISVTLWVLCVRIALKEAKLGIWQSKLRTHREPYTVQFFINAFAFDGRFKLF